jgi:hypothetical protein
VRARASLAALALALVVSGGASAAAPATTRVALTIPAESQVVASKVAVRNGSSWLAVAVDNELRVYRWQGRWTLDGTAELPGAFPAPGAFGGELAAAAITGSDAPDFTVQAYGADTGWFAIAAKTGGHWHTVPFDDELSSRDAFTFAFGAEDGLVHGNFDACGCAFGPTTDQWYRYAGGVFVAAGPPGQAAACTGKALAAASHWPASPGDPLVRDVARPFQVTRFSCADGWALATDGQNVALYEQHGPHLNTPAGHDWLRVGIGSLQLVRTRVEYALPRSLLDKLGTGIGVRFPPGQLQPAPRPGSATAAWQRAPIAVAVGPGDAYSGPELGPRPAVLTVRLDSTVARFSWRNGHWVAISVAAEDRWTRLARPDARSERPPSCSRSGVACDRLGGGLPGERGQIADHRVALGRAGRAAREDTDELSGGVVGEQGRDRLSELRRAGGAEDVVERDAEPGRRLGLEALEPGPLGRGPLEDLVRPVVRGPEVVEKLDGAVA